MRKAVRILAISGFAVMLLYATVYVMSFIAALDDIDITAVKGLLEASDFFVLGSWLLPSVTEALMNIVIVFYTFIASFSKKRKYAAEIVMLSLQCAVLPVCDIIATRITATSYASRIMQVSSNDFLNFYAIVMNYISSALKGGFAGYLLVAALALLLADKALAKKYADDTFEGVENYN